MSTNLTYFSDSCLLVPCRMKAEKRKPETEEEEEEEERKDAELNFDSEEIQRMHELARKLSQKIGQGLLSSKNEKSSGESGSDSKQGKGKSDSEVKVNASKSGKNSGSGSKSDPGNKAESRDRNESRKKSESGNDDSGSGSKDKSKSHAKTCETLGYKFKKKANSIHQKTENTESTEQFSRTSSSCDIVQREKTESPSILESHAKSNSGLEKRRREKDDQERDRRHKRKKHKRKDASEFG